MAMGSTDDAMLMPFSVVTNFIVNGEDLIVPMVQEEASVVAAASNAAKACRKTGGFRGECVYQPLAQMVQFKCAENVGQSGAVASTSQIAEQINAGQDEMRAAAASSNVQLFHAATAIPVSTTAGDGVAVQVQSDTSDTWLARKVTDAVVRAILGRWPHVRVVSVGSLRTCPRMTVKVSATWPKAVLKKKNSPYTGDQTADRLIQGWSFAVADPYRAATHNKGIMNGVSAVVRAAGADVSAVEARAHASGCGEWGVGGALPPHGATADTTAPYTSLTAYRRTTEGDLEGFITLQLPALGLSVADDHTPTCRSRVGVQFYGRAWLAPVMAAATSAVVLGACTKSGRAGAPGAGSAATWIMAAVAMAVSTACLRWSPQGEESKDCLEGANVGEGHRSTTEMAWRLMSLRRDPGTASLDKVSESRLAVTMAAVGLASNMAALWALGTEGIQSGHMRLHAANIAVAAGAADHEVDTVVSGLTKDGNVSVTRAKEILAEMKSRKQG